MNDDEYVADVDEQDQAVHPVEPRSTWAVDPDDAWADLLRNLGYHGTVREAGDGRIEVTSSTGDVVTVLVTRAQWAEVWAHEGDDFFHDLLGPRASDETFVVFHRGDLARSVRERLPPVASIASRLLADDMRCRYDEAIARDPNAQVGWFAYPPGEGPSDQARSRPG